MYLAERGARVIKEHAEHGDETRAFPPFFERNSVYFASVNRAVQFMSRNGRIGWLRQGLD
jgi:crotonobetainyl-CoA:carnitine CoA-transferase CaiB-like acyl-CoA transferase